MKALLVALLGAFVATSAMAALDEAGVATVRALMENAVQAKQIRDVPPAKVDNIVITISGGGGPGQGAGKSASISLQPGDPEFANSLNAIKNVAGRRFTEYVNQMQALGVDATP